MITGEDGITRMEEEELIFGTFFFLSDDIITMSRSVYNIITLLAEFGGFNSVLFAIYKVVGEALTKNIIVAKFIRSLYYRIDN